MKKTHYFFLSALLLAACEEKAAVVEEMPALKLGLSDDKTVDLKNTAENYAVSVTTNLETWSVKEQEDYDWIEASKSDDEILFDVEINHDFDERTAYFIVEGEGVEDQKIRVNQIGSSPVIKISSEREDITKEGKTYTISVTTNMEYEMTQDADWFTLSQAPETRFPMATDEWQIEVKPNVDLEVREGTITVTPQKTESFIAPLAHHIVQAGSVMSDVFPDDIQIGLQDPVLTYGNTYGNESIELGIDGKLNTQYSSSSTSVTDSIMAEFTLDPQRTHEANYVKIYQRSNKDKNSIFGRGRLEYLPAGKTEWVEALTFNQTGGADVMADVSMPNAEKIRLTISPETGRAVAFADIQLFYKAETGDFTPYESLFANEAFSQLAPGVTEAQINTIAHPLIKAVAKGLYAGTYSTEFRARKYQSIQSPTAVASNLAVSNRSFYENVTGVYFKAGEKVILMAGNIGDHAPTLRIKNFSEEGGEENFTIQPGLNIFSPTISGTGYLQYWTETAEKDQEVELHFMNGHEIGYWDLRKGDDDAKWKELMKKAYSLVIEEGLTGVMYNVLGQQTQLINTLDAYRDHCLDEVEKVIAVHDEMIMIQYSMMGLVKNNAVPDNLTLSLRTWGGLPNWGGQSANFPNEESSMLNPQSFKNGIWLYAHEVGHGNQVRPHMHMTGWGETSNNVYAQYCQYLMANPSNLRLDHENHVRKQGDSYPSVIGGRFNAYLNEAHVTKELYLTQEGPDYKKGSMNGQGLRGDHFVKCVPLWQLTIYFMIAGEGTDWHRPDFWADINWKAIQNRRTVLSNGERYVNFMKSAIEASNLNLTTFFENMGLLHPQDRYIDDYAVYKVTITQDQVDEVKALAATKPMPSSPVISYISINSAEAFKHQKEVEGVFGEGVTDSGNNLKNISHTNWKNVVVFETYQDDRMIDVSMVGTGSGNNSSTTVRYPEGATRIEAVSYSGQRTLVYGER